MTNHPSELADDCPVDGCERDYHHYHRTSPDGLEVLALPCDGRYGDCDDEGKYEVRVFTFTRCYCRTPREGRP